jgi:hypothetical protein
MDPQGRLIGDNNHCRPDPSSPRSDGCGQAVFPLHTPSIGRESRLIVDSIRGRPDASSRRSGGCRRAVFPSTLRASTNGVGQPFVATPADPTLRLVGRMDVGKPFFPSTLRAEAHLVGQQFGAAVADPTVRRLGGVVVGKALIHSALRTGADGVGQPLAATVAVPNLTWNNSSFFFSSAVARLMLRGLGRSPLLAR